MEFFVSRYRIILLFILFLSNELFSVPNQPSIVTISNYRLYVQKRLPDNSLDIAKPYIMQGVGWSPAGVGTGGGQVATYYSTDLPMIAEMHGNTIRNWGSFPLDANGLAALDECYNQGIMVIMTVDEQNYAPAVNYFKNHPAILMWLLGNEWNYNKFYGRYSTINECITAINNASAGIKALDSNHPVATCYGELPDSSTLASCTGPDIWGLNIYRGTSFGSLFSDWTNRSLLPMFISEFGADAYNKNISAVDEDSQSYGVKVLWSQISNNLSYYDKNNKVCVGGCIFEWNDEWWKSGNASSHDTGGFNILVYPDNFANEEWWGVVDINRNRRKVFWTMQSNWQSLGGGSVDISLDVTPPISSGNFNVYITTYFTNSPATPELKMIDPSSNTNALTLVGPDGNNNFTSSFSIAQSNGNGNYLLYFNCKTNGTLLEKYFYFNVDKEPPSIPVINKLFFENNSINIEWNSSSDNLSGVKNYKIYRSEDNLNFSFVGNSYSLIYKDSAVTENKKYYYKISAVDNAGNESDFSEVKSGFAFATELYVAPVPINFNTDELKINLNLSQDAAVTIKIYDIEGNLINTVLKSETISKGFVTKVWDGKDKYGNRVKNGIYYCYMEMAGIGESLKMFVVNNR